MTLPAVNDDLNNYLSKISTFPVLSAEKERELAVRYRDEEDLDAARDMVMSQLRFVVHLARSYTGYGLPLADLVQEGNIGLMKAVKRFDPDVGVRLISFAVHWIRAEIHEYVIRNWRIVKVATTKAQRKLFFKLRSSKKGLGWFSQVEAQAVAADLGVTEAQVYEMESRLTSGDTAFDAVSADDGSEKRALRPAEYLFDDESDPAIVAENSNYADTQSTTLAAGMEKLDDRSRDILQRRWLDEDGKSTLQDLADEYGVSAERIRQIEKAAMKKLKTHMMAH
ncbi:MAG: RNA polymerase sigma factor RpoH [Pseudomonadota bacterium]